MKYLTKGIITFEIVLLFILVFWHFKLGMVRFFDGDEFTHIHWGYSFSIGERPYTDFFYLFPPFFLYPIAALFKIFGRTAAVLINARIFIFFVFLATSGILFLLVRKLRGAHFALLTVIFFAFLPLPFDKMIEIRPDLLATGLALLGMYLFMKGDEGKKGDKGRQKKYFFLSGLSYAVSLGFVPKTVFFLLPVGLVMVSRYLVPPPRGSTSHTPEVSLGIGGEIKRRLPFFAGFLAVGIVLLTIITSYGNLSFAVYSMTRMASEVTKTLGAKFYMRPDIFFYPNDTYYGLPGWSAPLVINLIIYISASIWAIHKLLDSFFSTIGGVRASQAQLATPEVFLERNNSLGEFLVAGSFWANLIAFVNFYPLKHAQYLIPVAPFIAFYFADLWETILDKLPKSLKLLKWAVTLILLLLISLVGWQMNQKKATWVNTATIDKVSYFLKTIPSNASVFDLTGESVFFKNGYYFCCLPYGQYEESLYFKVPDIEKDLKIRDTKYVHIGNSGRLGTIPVRDARYIIDNFIAVSADKTLLIKK